MQAVHILKSPFITKAIQESLNALVDNLMTLKRIILAKKFESIDISYRVKQNKHFRIFLSVWLRRYSCIY